jgi:hypothetical protein
MALSMHTAAERPDLWERGIPSEEVWPEYNLHGDDLNRWWQHLDVELADFQFVLYDEVRGVLRILDRASEPEEDLSHARASQVQPTVQG